MTPQRRRILTFVLIGLVIGAVVSCPFFVLVNQFAGFLPVNTCYSSELDGKTDQEIADLLGYPLVTLSRIPADLPDEPHVFTISTETGCQLRTLYGLYTEASVHLEIMVYSSNNQSVEEGWKCNESPSPDFETVCYSNTQYLGKYYGMMLQSPYSLAETQALTEFVEISAQ